MKASTILVNCAKYLGKPYVWGGESMEEGGYDCSGYVYNVLKDSGMKVGRSTAQGYSSLGTTVTEAKEGDLLFFGKSTKSITHIAICAGNSKMYESIGTSRNTKTNVGKGVTLSNMSRRKDLILIKRIVTEENTSSNYYPKCDGKYTSLVDALKSINIDSTYSTRKKIAIKNGINNYSGLGSQNVKLLGLLKNGKLIKI